MLKGWLNVAFFATAWSPVVIVVGLHEVKTGQPWKIFFIYYMGLAVALFLTCLLLLYVVRRKYIPQPITIDSIENKDQEVLTFILVTLLPIMRASDKSIFCDDLTTMINLAIVGIITFTLYSARAYHFNPVIRLFLGYRCYSIKNSHGTPILLISKKVLRRPCKIESAIPIADFVHLQVGNKDEKEYG